MLGVKLFLKLRGLAMDLFGLRLRAKGTMHLLRCLLVVFGGLLLTVLLAVVVGWFGTFWCFVVFSGLLVSWGRVVVCPTEPVPVWFVFSMVSSSLLFTGGCILVVFGLFGLVFGLGEEIVFLDVGGADRRMFLTPFCQTLLRMVLL